MSNMQKYLQSCNTDFWKNVFKAELDYILRELKGDKNVLSVGCGPAIIEAGLSENGFNVTGLDISKEALNQAPDNIRTVVGSAENMDFADNSFDAVIYIASLQFIENYKEAIKQTARVLRPGGKLLTMLLNPDSEFFKKKSEKPDSYINKIRHADIREIEKTIAEYFFTQTEFFLGIKGQDIFETKNPDLASLYVIKGKKKQSL
ncbi:MAG: class I SAM-dependent methyltransferase [Sedimentisphaerales bacterium]|nr:class I SAM-dependent methyltransferase [Sedimentisphaerales bacterium]